MIVFLLEPLDSWSPPPISFTGIHREPGKMVAIVDLQPTALNEGDLPPKICEASPHLTWWWESQASWHQWVRKPEARAGDSSDMRSLGNNCR